MYTQSELEELIEEEKIRIRKLQPIDYCAYSELYEWEKAIRERFSKLKYLEWHLRQITQNYKLSEIPEYGDLLELEDFISCVNDGGFIDYDGNGYYATNNKMSNIEILPSDITKYNIYRKDFTHVVWFNR